MDTEDSEEEGISDDEGFYVEEDDWIWPRKVTRTTTGAVEIIEGRTMEERLEEEEREKELDDARHLDTEKEFFDEDTRTEPSEVEENGLRLAQNPIVPWRNDISNNDMDISTDDIMADSQVIFSDSGFSTTTIRHLHDEQATIWMASAEFWEETMTPDEQSVLAMHFLRPLSGQGDYFVATKYKPVGKKVLPINTATPPTNPNPPLRRPPLSRDPFETPLRPDCPPVVYSAKVTKERCDALDFGPEGWLTLEEENLYRTILVMRGAALAFEDKDRGLLKETYASPYIFSTKEHTPWRQRPLPIPKAIQEEVIQLIKDRLESGLYEEASSTYSGRWFVVQKKNGKFRLVHDLQELNRVTYRDAGLPPQIEEFVEEFMGYTCYSLVDIFGGYDQYPLDESSRDITTFQTPIGPFRLTRLPQGFTNSVAVYQRMMTFIMAPEIPRTFNVFIDDGGIKGSKDYYDNATIDGNSGIRRFIWEHAVNLERILFRLEEAGLTVSGVKMSVAVPSLGLVGTNVSYEGRKIQSSKLNKIARYPRPTDVSELRGFLGVCTYVRIWVEGFAKITLPLRLLLRKDAEWDWDEDCEKAFVEMKRRVGKDILLKRLEYGPDAGEIIVAVDSSWIAVGVGVFQVDKNGRRQPVRYESISFTSTESRYSQPKLELAGVAKALHQLRNVIWGQHFVLEVDALYIKEMLNTPELPNAAMTRWVRYILLFDFEFRHVPGKKHTLPDGLSRARRDDEDSDAMDLDDMIEEVNLLRMEREVWEEEMEDPRAQIFVVGVVTREQQAEVWDPLRHFLATLERPDGISDGAWRRIRTMAPHFFLAEGRLWRRHEPNHQEVILDEGRQQEFFQQLHDELGHRGRNETYRRMVERAWWPGISKSVADYVKTCDACQKRKTTQEREVRHATVPRGILSKVHFDAVHIKAGPYPYFISGRDDLTGWIEGRALRQLTSKAVAKFIRKEFLHRYGWFEQATVDGGGEFRGEVEDALRTAGVRRVVSAPYAPEGNARAERGHQEIIEGLAKITDTPAHWHRYINAVLFADRISTSRTTGFSPYELMFGTRPVLPIDIGEETWVISEWWKVKTREDLLEARLRQILRMDDDVKLAIKRMAESRQKGVLYHDKVNAHRLREPLAIGTLVLYQNVLKEASHGRKLEDRWFGPFRVRKRLDKGSYLLEEVDGTKMASVYPSKRLRRYHPRGDYRHRESEMQEADSGHWDFLEPGYEQPLETSSSGSERGQESWFQEGNRENSSRETSQEEESDSHDSGSEYSFSATSI